jgi:predicted lysophospholipase L1 biosynthesis ABC-type transport system permease subunit
MGLGPAVGVVLLLCVLTAYGVLTRQDSKRAARYGVVDQGGYVKGQRDVTLRWDIGTTFGGRPITATAFHTVGAGPVPPGVETIPAPGELVASPALATLLRGPEGELLRPRLPGTITGTIAEAGLLAPDELVAYVGVPLTGSGLPEYRLTTSDAMVIASSEGVPGERFGLTLVLVLVLLALLVPTSVLISTTARLSAATRDSRIASLRLIGASRRELRYLLTVETSLVAAIGSVVGVLTFALARSVFFLVPGTSDHWFASAMGFPALAAVAVIVAVPLFGALVSALSVRSVVRNPLSHSRRGVPAPRKARWPIALVSGIALLAVCAATTSTLTDLPAPLPGVAIGGALLLVVTGLAGTAPWLARTIAARRATRVARASGLIASRRLEASPTSATRAVGSIAVFLGLIIVIQGITMLGSRTGADSLNVGALSSSDVIVVADRPTTLRAAKSGGVTSVSPGNGVFSWGSCHRDYPCGWVFHTDGDPQTVERVKNALGWHSSAQTREEIERAYSAERGQTSAIVRILWFVVLVILLVTGASLLIAAVDGITERKASFAALSAFGVPRGVLYRAVAAEIAGPSFGAALLGSAVGLVVLFLLAAVAQDPLPIPVLPLVGDLVFVVAITALTVGAAIAWTARSTGAQFLRAE